MYIDNAEFVLTVTKLAGVVGKKSKRARLESQILEKALLAIVGVGESLTIACKVNEKVDESENEAPTEEEKAQFDREIKLVGVNTKESTDRLWLLATVKEAWNNPANWTDQGMMVRCAGDRAFGDNLAGYLRDNGISFNELNISPGIAGNGEGGQVATWELVFVR